MSTYYVLQFRGDSGRWLTCDDEQYATLEDAAAALEEVSGGPVPYRIAEAYFVVRYRPVK